MRLRVLASAPWPACKAPRRSNSLRSRPASRPLPLRASQLGKRLLNQIVEMARLPEEIGLIGCDNINQMDNLFLLPLMRKQVVAVLLDRN